MKYLSDQNRTCFQYESGTYALLSGTRQWIGLVQTHDVEPNINVIQIRYQGSTDRNVDDFEDGQKEWAGTISYFPQDWKMLGFAIGSIQDVTGSHIFYETNTDDHVLAQSPNGYPNALHSFTVEDSKNLGNAGSNFIRTVIGATIDTYQINFAQGEIVSAEIGYIAQDATMSSGAITSLASTNTKPFMFNDVIMGIPSGTVLGNLKEGTFSINNNLERGFYLNGSRVAHELLPMNKEYEVTATCDMDEGNARTLYETYYVGGSTFNSSIVIQGIAGSLSPGSLGISMSGCKMTEMTIPSALEGIQEQSFTFVPSHVSAAAYDAIGKYNP